MRRTVPDECDVLLREGGIAHIRPLRPDDRAQLHELVDRSSEQSAYLRFFTGGTATAHAYMDRVTTPGYPGRALVALTHGRLVAIAEYIPGDAGDAEIVILIDDEMHPHGLGTLLVEHLALNAADEGMRELIADVLTENRPMLRVLNDIGLDMLDTARLLATQPLPQGRRVAIVGNSGGPQVLAADACEQRGLLVPELAPITRGRLRAGWPARSDRP
ncbi:GNAT family N-acetyltransferase [Streptosporangium sp. NPDC000396]|uniref:GNAT family N-acetyltransferase n=1 Tax=Streptosporangium sp. NPDC000396 TaxID=3366185 RepID=UPI0036C2AB99